VSDPLIPHRIHRGTHRDAWIHRIGSTHTVSDPLIPYRIHTGTHRIGSTHTVADPHRDAWIHRIGSTHTASDPLILHRIHSYRIGNLDSQRIHRCGGPGAMQSIFVMGCFFLDLAETAPLGISHGPPGSPRTLWNESTRARRARKIEGIPEGGQFWPKPGKSNRPRMQCE